MKGKNFIVEILLAFWVCALAGFFYATNIAVNMDQSNYKICETCGSKLR